MRELLAVVVVLLLMLMVVVVVKGMGLDSSGGKELEVRCDCRQSMRVI